MIKAKQLVMVFMVAVLIISGCSTNEGATQRESEKETTSEKTFYYAIGGEIKKFDPHIATTLSDFTVVSSIWNTLVRFPNGTTDISKIEGDLAEKWEKNENATEWTFHLRKGVKWHRGYGELTAEDVKYSIARVMDKDTGSASRSDYENVKRIEAKDTHTVVFHLKKSDPNFLLIIVNSGPGGWIVNKKATEENKPYIGTGPFMFEEYKTSDRAVLVKNKEYFRGEPKLDKIVYKIMTDPTATEVAMANGAIHMARITNDPLRVEKLKQNKDLVLDHVGPLVTGGVFINISKPPFDDIRVRQAIAYSIDTKSYVKNFVGETGSEMSGPIASDVFASADVGKYEYNPEKAKQLLKEAGYENGLKLPKQFVSSSSHILDKMTFVQDQLYKVGIEVPLEQVENAVYQANVRKDMNNLSVISYSRLPHADKVLTPFFYGPSTVGTPTGSLNFSHYNKSDDLIEKARFEPDVEKAKQMYKEIQEQIKNEYVYIPLAEQKSVNMRRKEVDLGYNNNQIQATMLYNYILDENTDIK